MTTMNTRLYSFIQGGDIFRRSSGQKLDGKTNGADIALTLIITKQGETSPDLDLCSYNEMPDGVVCGESNGETNLSNDPQDPYADNINVDYKDIHKDDEVCLCIGEGKGATLDHLAVIDVDNPGFVESMSPSNESIAAVPPFRILGRFMATYTAVSNKAQFGWVKGK